MTTPKQQQILELIRQHGPMSISDIATRLRTSIPTARTHTQALRREGLISPTCVGRWSRWEAGRNWESAIAAAPSVWAYAQRCQ